MMAYFKDLCLYASLLQLKLGRKLELYIIFSRPYFLIASSLCSASDLGRIQATSKKNSFQRILVTHHGATFRKRCSSIGGVQAKNQRAFDFVIHSKESPKFMDNL
jgi:hypothetical protein